MPTGRDHSTTRDFRAYYEGIAGRPPRPTLLQAADGFAKPGFAVDLGCGDGRDTIELLRRGWRVLAIDSSEEGLSRLRARPDLPSDAGVETRLGRIEESDWPLAELINASFVLPLIAPDSFPAVWSRIRDRLAFAGRFAGQLYGPRDGWAGRAGMTIHDRAGVEALTSGYAVERLDEVETDEPTAKGVPKHWHVFHLVLLKR